MRQDLEYVGFWARVGAGLIDLLLQVVITAPLTIAVYGTYMSSDERIFQGPADMLINVVLPAVAVLAFWIYKGATPGKMAMSARIVDASTGDAISTTQAVLRYLGYIVSALPLGVGYLWIAFDRRKQGWHDKIAGTVVIRPAGDEKVRFHGGRNQFAKTEPRL